MAESTPNMANFDIWHQNFTLRDPNGELFVASTIDFDSLQNLGTTTAIVFSSQLGASLMLLVVLLLMTTSAKRRSLSFILNALALVCNVIRCTLQCVLLNSPLMSFMVLELYDWDAEGMPQALATSVTDAVFTLLLFVFIELSLITQVRVVCLATSHAQRTAVTTITGLVALIAVAFRIHLLIVNIHNIIHVSESTKATSDLQSFAQSQANIAAIVSICVFSFVFCYKLAMAIRSRRSLGLKQFGAMQIIFIMGCQTLIVPVIFAILAYYALPGAQIRSFVETMVAIFLPLSSMWASANTQANTIVTPEPSRSCRRPHQTGRPIDSAYQSKKKLLSSLFTETLINSAEDSIDGSPLKEKPSAGLNNRASGLSAFDHDLEMQSDTIHVDRSFTVSSDRDSLGRAR